ncbi:ABC transporter permease [[Limnothrix rosea] IAM M-220]|uniref:ABC transporter permease n=1 Tax=[Limnothrix rosea] IAM M-220 TaxID=454133 RepID=UPI000960A3B5|nr:ABC transporter permease [[Limnothrix rosea] IAM M-220]OKH13804.1 ABC transporter permease [[Limnothrix rosea] IAM M-220]
MILNNILAILRRELQQYFFSPVSYIFATLFWFLAGIFFLNFLIGPQSIVMDVAMREQQGLPLPPIDVAAEFLQLFWSVIGALSSFLLPLLSMGLYAEERKQGTLELLATSPLTNWSVAVGKLLGVVSFFSVLLVPIVLWEIIVIGAAEPAVPLLTFLWMHVGVLLLAAAVLSLGMFISSLTESALIAAIMTFSLVLVLWFLELLGDRLTGYWGGVIRHLSLLRHYNNFLVGIVDSSSLVLFVSYIVLGVVLTAQSIEYLRFARR